MPDTERTQTEMLNSLFQDGQVANSITAQDMRDSIVSIYNPGKLILVEQKSDFPAPVSGVISLAADVCYRIVNDIDLETDVLSVTSGTTIIEGLSDDIITLQTSSASPLITATKRVEIGSIRLLNDVGPCINFTASSPESITVRNSIFTSATDDVFAGGAAFLIFNSQWAFGSAGLIINGVWTTGIFRNTTFRNISGTPTMMVIQAGTTFANFSLEGGQFLMSAGQTGLDIATDVLPSTGGSVSGNVFDAAASGSLVLAAGKIDQTSVGWNFQSNSGIEDSAHVGEIEFSGNTLATTINTINVYETIATTPGWTLDPISERFILRVADSRSLEHLGGKNMRTLVSYIATVEGATPNNVYEIRLLKNGVEVDSTIWDYRSSPINVSHNKILTLNTNDYLTLEIRNTSGSGNVTVSAAQISAVKAG